MIILWLWTKSGVPKDFTNPGGVQGIELVAGPGQVELIPGMDGMGKNIHF
jgi:hypothetical protein